MITTHEGVFCSSLFLLLDIPDFFTISLHLNASFMMMAHVLRLDHSAHRVDPSFLAQIAKTYLGDGFESQ
jgi:hypothetical protein